MVLSFRRYKHNPCHPRTLGLSALSANSKTLHHSRLLRVWPYGDAQKNYQAVLNMKCSYYLVFLKTNAAYQVATFTLDYLFRLQSVDVLQLNRSCSFATLDDVLLHSDCNGLLFGNDGSRTTLTNKISPVIRRF